MNRLSLKPKQKIELVDTIYTYKIMTNNFKSSPVTTARTLTILEMVEPVGISDNYQPV